MEPTWGATSTDSIRKFVTATIWQAKRAPKSQVNNLGSKFILEATVFFLIETCAANAMNISTFAT